MPERNMNLSNAQNETAGSERPDELRLHLRDGLTIVVPATLSAVTTYVLLEQEKWFEKEIDFLRAFVQQGMTVIDVGANLGVYSLPLARLVGPGGSIFAYEPGGEARALLARSVAFNGFTSVEVIDAALSDRAGAGHLAFASSSELRALGTDARGEPIRITSLDVEDRERGWRSVDLIKIDAEGEQERIITGGRSFFAAHSPLVMFEVMAQGKVNERLRAIFPEIGYRLFRQLPGAPVLVPDDTLPHDGYELNLFAAKSDRVSMLAERALLVEAIPSWAPGDDDRKNALLLWQRQCFSSLATGFDGSGSSTDFQYLDGLAAYAKWRDLDQPIAIRCAALAVALQSIREACERHCTAERASTWARAAWEWGARTESLTALQRLLEIERVKPVGLREPFWPASSRFDAIEPGSQPNDWFVASAAEQLEQSFSFSSAFSGASPFLPWLCDQPLACTEMERRRTLVAARSGLRPRVPERLCVAAPDHLNAEVWRTGLVPGTVVGP
jgi:FkbM family methyltransferase